jgi:protein dithiol oxidoreductase (disulfide-forming)
MLLNFFRIAVAVAFVGAFALDSAHAQAPESWEAGKQYFLIDPPVATHAPGKIEVTEVFSYGCPACNFSLPSVDKLAKSLPPNAVMNYVPASFNPAEDWPLFQRTFFTAQALGLPLEKTHHAMFEAVWKTHELATMNPDGRTLKNPQPSLDEVAKFFVSLGTKAEDFTATASSFSINTKMKQADAYIKATGVDVTPTIIINGKYRLTTTSAGGDWDKASQLVLFLVNKESGAK